MVDARHAHRAAVHTAREGGAGAHRLSLPGQGRCARLAGRAPSRPALRATPQLATSCRMGLPCLVLDGAPHSGGATDRTAQSPMRGRGTVTGYPPQPVADSAARTIQATTLAATTRRRTYRGSRARRMRRRACSQTSTRRRGRFTSLASLFLVGKVARRGLGASLLAGLLVLQRRLTI